MNTFNEVDKYLKNLELKTYSIKEIADIIRNIDSLTKEGLFVDDYDDDFYKDIELIFHPETGEKINVEDCYVDLTYQRVLKLKQLVDHLRATDKDGNPMQYDKMCAGSIDLAIRPDGKCYVWDGFRRSLIALLKGIRFPLFSVYMHPKTRTIQDCRAVEAFAFKKRNGDNEAMARDELYKSGIVFENPKDLKTRGILEESGLDVLKTVPDAEKYLSGFAEWEDTIIKERVDPLSQIKASKIVSLGWKDESTVSSYVVCGLSLYIQRLADDKLSWSANVTGLDDGSCDFVPLFKEYAKSHNMVELTRNRLSGKGLETVSFIIATKVLQLNDHKEEVELAISLGFDDEQVRILTMSEKLKNT